MTISSRDYYMGIGALLKRGHAPLVPEEEQALQIYLKAFHPTSPLMTGQIGINAPTATPSLPVTQQTGVNAGNLVNKPAMTEQEYRQLYLSGGTRAIQTRWQQLYGQTSWPTAGTSLMKHIKKLYKRV